LSLQNTKLSITAVVDLNAFHLNPSHAKNHTWLIKDWQNSISSWRLANR